MNDFETMIEKAVKDENVDLLRFHIIGKDGNPTGVFDYEIHKYIKQTESLFIMGGIPYIYKGGYYKADKNGSMLKTMIRDLIIPKFVKSNTIKRVYELFLSDAELQKNADEVNNYPERWIPFKDCFYDPIWGEVIDHDPKYFLIHQIPHNMPKDDIKDSFVSDWLHSIMEESDMKMLLQYAGYCMTMDTRQQKLLILCGEGGTGKSTLIKMINLMVGAENISNISLNQLSSNRFASYGLIGKLVNSCADLEIDALTDTSTLKKVLGEDSIQVEAKGKDSISITSYAKLLFSTNELPIVKGERTNGFFRRLLVLPMNKTPAEKDTCFFDKLSAHIDDFILLCLKALEEMYINGTIFESDNSIEAVKQLRSDSDTVEAFINELCTKDIKGRTKKALLYSEYEKYCSDSERQSLTKNNFYKALRTKGYSDIKTGGDRFIKGISFGKTALKLPLNEFENAPDDELPFD